jgi:predicted nucleic acid-binding protein
VAVYFVETSALVKRYVQEDGTEWVQNATDPVAAHSIYVAEITLVEAISALRKAERQRSISEDQAKTAISDFRYDFETQYLVIRLNSQIIERAASLAESHPLRAYDAVQLAVAVEIFNQSQANGLPAPLVVSSDTTLNDAAVKEGLKVEDPTS